MPNRVYLDWNATTPLRPQAREAMTAAFELCGNPSSVHAEGRAARRLIEDARRDVARLVRGPAARRKQLRVSKAGAATAHWSALTDSLLSK